MDEQRLELTELSPRDLEAVNGGAIQLITATFLGHVLWEAVTNPQAHNKAFWAGYIEARNL